MKLSYIPDSLGYLPFEKMLDVVQSLGIRALEIPTGNWSKAPHLNLEELVSSKVTRDKYTDELKKRGIELIALNCSGNPLASEKDMDVTRKTFLLAEMLGVKKIVMMSGLPVGCKGDNTPVCRMVGYNDYVSLEMEDMTMTPLEGVRISIDALRQAIR
jgi:sugar phosphate isomerase/epimerase